MMLPPISVTNLSKCYQTYSKPADRLKQGFFRTTKQYYQEFWPLKDISFELKRGEVVGVIGSNGAGKSTLLQVLAGILNPTLGKVDVNGRVAALLELGAGFNPEFTGQDNLYMNASLLGLSKAETDAKYQDIVDFAGIGDFIHQPVKTYSSGMYVRLAFAITVFVDADILIVDEALAVGDAAFQAKCFARLETLLKSGVTILLVTHDVHLVKSYCDRVLYLNKGKLLFDGDCEAGVEMYEQDYLENDKNRLGKVVAKAVLYERKGAYAFGTELGQFSKVTLTNEGIERDTFQTNQRATLVLSGRVSSEIKRLRVHMVVRDSNGCNLFAYNNEFAEQPIVMADNDEFECELSFNCALAADDYSITVRLDEMHSKLENSLIEKQVNVIQFSVVNDAQKFNSRFDLNGSFDCSNPITDCAEQSGEMINS